MTATPSNERGFARPAVTAKSNPARSVAPSTTMVDDGSVIRVAIGPGGRMIVEDDGPGIETASADALFEPFRRGTTAVEGAGLGLAIVRQSVQLHKGAVTIGRSATGGARFEINVADQK